MKDYEAEVTITFNTTFPVHASSGVGAILIISNLMKNEDFLKEIIQTALLNNTLSYKQNVKELPSSG